MTALAERKKLLAEFSNGVRKLKKAVHRLPKAEMDFRPFDGAWTIHEHVIHLVDMEINSYTRWRCIAAESGKTIMTVDEDKWTANIRYESQSVTDHVSVFALLRKMTVQYLTQYINDGKLWEENHVLHPERGKLTMKDWVKLYAAHADMHVKYIERNKNIWKKSHAK